jgi:hypothetical protein
MNVMTTIDTKYECVLDYLKRLKFQYESNYDKLMFFSIKPNDIIKYITNPEQCGNWPFEYVCKIEHSITQIFKKFIVDFPKIELQTEEDRVISKLLKKNPCFAFGTNTFFDGTITVNHIIAYMEREEKIYQWNGDFVIQIQQKVKKIKEYLL